MRAVHALAILAAVLFLGLKGLMLGGGIWVRSCTLGASLLGQSPAPIHHPPTRVPWAEPGDFGLLCAVAPCVQVLYKLNQASSGAAVPGQQGGRGAAQSAQQFFQQFMQQQPGAGSGTGGGPVGGRQGGPSAGGGGRQAGGDSWTAKGKPHKLGSA